MWWKPGFELFLHRFPPADAPSLSAGERGVRPYHDKEFRGNSARWTHATVRAPCNPSPRPESVANRLRHTPSMKPTQFWKGHPYPLGATWAGNGVNFTLFSQHA